MNETRHVKWITHEKYSIDSVDVSDFNEHASIHSFIHSFFIQYMFTENPLAARC